MVVSGLVIAGVFAFALPRIADYGAVWDEIQQISWPWIVALVLSVLLNTATYGPPWMAALPGLAFDPADGRLDGALDGRAGRRGGRRWRRSSRC